MRLSRVLCLTGAMVSACFSESNMVGDGTADDTSGTSSTASTGTTSSSTSTMTTSTSTSTSDTSSGSSEGTAGTTGTAECGQGVCVPAAPAQWNGPVLLQAHPPGPPPMQCPQGDGPINLMAGQNPLADPALCGDCACAPPTQPCSAHAYVQGDAQCTANISSVAVPPGVCTQVGTAAAVVVEATAEATCMQINPNNPPPPPIEWETVLSGCELQEGPACTGGTCVPTVREIPTCVWADGDLSCPAGWPQKQLFFHDWEDTRECSPCACGPLMGLDCDGPLAVSASDDCMLTIGDTMLGDCIPTEAFPAGVNVEWTPNDTTGGCMHSGGEPVGGVTPIQPLTACCL